MGKPAFFLVFFVIFCYHKWNINEWEAVLNGDYIFYGVSNPLAIAIIVLVIVAIIVGIWSMILRIQIFSRYRRNNRIDVGHGLTAQQVARQMLDNLGYHDVQVVRASYFWFWFFQNWGNRYSPRRNKILLYGNILNSSTVTAIALATQKVGLVMQHRAGEPKMVFRARWEFWTRMAPNLFIPIITIGLVIDLVVNGGDIADGAFGIVTLVFVGIAILYTLIAMGALYMVIPTERRAGQLALEKIQQYNLVPSEFIPNIQEMFATYVKAFIADFVLAIVNLLIDILWLVAKLSNRR